MSNPKKQHIVSKTLLKKFSKNKEQVDIDIKKLGDKYSKTSKRNKDFSNESCYRILKEDFDKNDNFIITENNIVSVEDKSVIEENLYSLSVDSYRSFLERFNIDDNKDHNSIKYLLEKDFNALETNFGNFMKLWNDGNINIFNIREKGNKIINFIQSNELRGKHIYKNLQPEKEKLNIKNYAAFDKIIFFAFVELYVENILINSDYFETIELYNYLYFRGFIDNNDLNKKLISKINNSFNNQKSNIIFIENKTDTSYLLSDVATAIFYNNFKFFNEILEIIGEDNFEQKPSKITIMPLQHNLIAVVCDVPVYKNYYTELDLNNVKKTNSLLCSKINEWLIVYDITKEKNDIIDKNLLKKMKNIDIDSNCLDWYKQALISTSYSNIKYKYVKIEKASYDLIKPILQLLDQLHKLANEFNDKKLSYVNIKNKKIRYSNNNNGILVGKLGILTNILIIKNEKLYNFFNSLTKEQIESIQRAFENAKLSNIIFVDNKQKQVVFYKNKTLSNEKSH